MDAVELPSSTAFGCRRALQQWGAFLLLDSLYQTWPIIPYVANGTTAGQFQLTKNSRASPGYVTVFQQGMRRMALLRKTRIEPTCEIGILLSRNGCQRKMGRSMGCCVTLDLITGAGCCLLRWLA